MRTLLATAATALLLTAPPTLADEPGRLRKLDKPGPHEVMVGDLILIAFPSNPSTGPANPAASLKVVIKGVGLAPRAIVVFAPPARPLPGAPGEIQAYLPCVGEGTATVMVTPISGSGQEGPPLSYAITAGK